MTQRFATTGMASTEICIPLIFVCQPDECVKTGLQRKLSRWQMAGLSSPFETLFSLYGPETVDIGVRIFFIYDGMGF